MQDLQEIIRLEEVSFRRAGRVIFSNLSFSINRGEVVGVMGPSGTGKTTLMRLITGQLAPSSGRVFVFGRDLSTLSRAELMELRRNIGMLFQSNALFTDMTVFDNVAFPLREVAKLPKELIEILVAMKLQTVGLAGARYLMPQELSGGMMRRAALARAMALDPKIMIYDEPFTGQDPITLGMLAKLVRDFSRGLDMTSLIVSHDVAEVAAIADRILLIADGKLLALDVPEKLYQSEEPMIKQFMHALSDGPVPFHYPNYDYLADMRGAV
ncbi:MAG: ATP-binding cassette domain-containing protein [Cardiobacteriaceae bacterium]|nr:ATP-binding cassette domain-containing protein [Cardiobacteriaceae bacterium]